MPASLPRRPILGIVVSGFSEQGVRAASVRDGSMAAAAGVVADDVITAIEGHPVRNARELRVALRACGTEATIESTRGSATVPVQRRAELAGTSYEHVTSAGLRLRTLIERRDARATAVFLQGISLGSIEDAAPVTQLLEALPFTTMRVEKRGVGDSDGDAPDFEEELTDFRSALASVDTPIVLIGHSVGGMIAPLVYDERVAAIVVLGTSSERWLACLAASARRQAALFGADPEAMAAAQRDAIEADRDERSRAFHHQLDRVDLRSAWSRVRCPTLVMHGEYDWVVSEAEARAIVSFVPGASFASVAQIDHALTRHDSLEQSVSAFGRGADAPAIREIVASFAQRAVSCVR